MGWIFHSKKGWGLIQISGSNHQSGMPRFTSFRPQIPQNQAAPPTRTGLQPLAPACQPMGPPKISSSSSQLAGVRHWGIPARPHGQGNMGNRPCSWNLRFQQSPKVDFEPRRDLPQRAERCVLYTRRGFGLGEEGWGVWVIMSCFLISQ